MRARENTLEETQSTESSSTTPEGGTKSDSAMEANEADFDSANDQMVSEASEAKDPETSDPVEDQEKHSDLTLEQDLEDKDPQSNETDDSPESKTTDPEENQNAGSSSPSPEQEVGITPDSTTEIVETDIESGDYPMSSESNVPETSDPEEGPQILQEYHCCFAGRTKPAFEWNKSCFSSKRTDNINIKCPWDYFHVSTGI